MSEKENVKKLSLWQKVKLRFALKFKKTIPEDCAFGAIDAMSVDLVEKFRYKLLSFNAENLHPLFEKRNAKKLKAICSYTQCAKAVIDYLEKDGSEDEIRAYLNFSGYPISLDWAEKYFLNRHIDDFFKPYLESHENHLPDEVVDLLIERKQEEFLCYYISLFKEDEYHNIDRRLLFESSMDVAQHDFAEKFVDDHGCRETICYILKHGNDTLVEKLLNKRALDSDEEYELMFDRDNAKFIDMVIEKKQSTYLSELFWTGLLVKGSTEQVIKCIDKFSLDEQNEYQLVCGGENEAILHYLEKVKRPFAVVTTENLLFKNGDEEILDFYRKNICLPYAEERTLIKEGDSEKILQYIKRENVELYTMNMVLLVETCSSVDILKTLVETYNFSDIVEVALMRRNIPEVCSMYIEELVKDDEALSIPAEVELIKTGHFELVEKYMRAFKYDLYEESQKALLNRGNIALLKYFCEESAFDEDIVIDFVKHASFELLKSYFENNVSLNPLAEVALIERNQPGLTKLYLSKVDGISEEGEVALVCLKNFELLKEYIVSTPHGLQLAAEKELLKVADEDLFGFYIERTPLFDENGVELVKSGNRSWIEAYTEKYDLREAAADELAKVY